MWEKIRSLFGGKHGPADHKGPDPGDKPDPPLSWIAAAESPFGVEVLDIRPFTGTMISTSKDPRCAANAVGWRRDSGRSFRGASPEGARRIDCELRYQAPAGPLDGRWFCPEVMEEKWALYHHDGCLYAIRSWTRTLWMKAHTRRVGDEVVITGVDAACVAGAPPEPDDLVVRQLDFLVKSHVLGAPAPAPIPADMKRDPETIAMWCFSRWGRRAEFASFADLRGAREARPVRLDSPLFLAIDTRAPEEALARIAEAGPEEIGMRARYAGLTPLHGAAILGYAEVMDALLTRGAQVDATSDLGRTPLHELASFREASLDIANLLLASGARARARDAEGAEPLHLAAQTGTVEMIRRLLEAGADAGATTDRGFSPLHQAAEVGRADVVAILLDAGADPNLAAGEWTPLRLAEEHDRREVAALLRARGAR